MAVLRLDRFTIDPADTGEMLARHAARRGTVILVRDKLQVGPRRACLIPERSGVAPLTSHAAARSRQAGTSFGSQAMTGRQRI